MSFKEYYFGTANGGDEKLEFETTKRLVLVSKEDAVHGMFDRLSFEEGEDSEALERKVCIKCNEIKNSSETVQDHLGINGMMSSYKKVAVNLEKEEVSINVCVTRRKNRIVFSYNQDNGGLTSSIQKADKKSPDGSGWKHLGELPKKFDDLYSIMVAVEKHDLINGGGSL